MNGPPTASSRDPGHEFDAPSGGRNGTRGGYWTSHERFYARASFVDDDPGPGWENVIRAIEDDCTPVD